MNAIRLGFEIDTAEEVKIPIGHSVFTGVSNLTGKTTAIEGCAMRSGYRAVAFITKVGEKNFLTGKRILPYYKDDKNWRTIVALVESAMKERIGRQERYKIIQLAEQEGGNGVIDFKNKIDAKLQGKLSSFERDIFSGLRAYFEDLVEQMKAIKFSQTLELSQGINVIDLEEFAGSDELQSLIIKSVVEEVQYKYENTIVIIPEAWRFLPQERGNPCKIAVETLCRQGAAKGNFVWLDSQDIAGLDKAPLKQMSVWVMGYQSERNEVKHTLEQLPISKSERPDPDEIMNLRKGVFYFASREGVHKTYVQPVWLDEVNAIKIAKGELKVEDVAEIGKKFEIQQKEVKFSISRKEERLTPKHVFSEEQISPKILEAINRLENTVADLSLKVENSQDGCTSIYDSKNPMMIEIRQTFKTLDTQISAILSDIKAIQNSKGSPAQNIEKVVEEIVKKHIKSLPSGGKIVEQISPVEALQKKFLTETKQRIIDDVSKLSPDAMKLLQYLEVKQKGVKANELCEKCFIITVNGTNYEKMVQLAAELASINVGVYDSKHKIFYGKMQSRVEIMLGNFGASQQEIDSVYNHVMLEILTQKITS